MTRKYVRQTEEEKLFIKKISVISGLPEKTIKEVFLSTLMAFIIEYFDDDDDFTIFIPYLLKLKLETKDINVQNVIIIVLQNLVLKVLNSMIWILKK